MHLVQPPFRVERLVGVQIERTTEVPCRLEQIVEASVVVRIEVRATSDNVDPSVERVAQKGAVVGSFTSGERGSDERDDLQVDEISQRGAHSLQCLNRSEPASIDNLAGWLTTVELSFSAGPLAHVSARS